jgi:DNA-binding NtrC family response regulator
MSARPEVPRPERRHRVLLVHGDRRFREAVAGRLAGRGFAVEAVADEPEALRLIQAEPPEAVILDQGTSGIEESLQEIGRVARQTPVILLVGNESQAEAERKKFPGVFALVAKPCGLDELTDKLAAACAVQKRASVRERFFRACRGAWAWLGAGRGRRLPPAEDQASTSKGAKDGR